MATIRSYVKDRLLHPLKYYPTAIQETMIELIIQKLESLYDYSLMFPEIVTPSKNRLDILKVIADQFLFNIRDEADLQEQINILDNILYVYSKRGSIDTIENMWKYYGGDLPKEVQVIIPSYNLFRYSISPFSGAHVYQDGDTNHTGIYEIRLTNNTYPIPELKEFLIKELVAAGNYIYFTNAISSDIRGETSDSSYKYNIMTDDLLELQMRVAPSHHGLILSGLSASTLSGSVNPVWSGKENIFIDIVKTIMQDEIVVNYIPDILGFSLWRSIEGIAQYRYVPIKDELYKLESLVYCTPMEKSHYIARYLYNNQGQQVREKNFILADSLLGEHLGYEIITEEIVDIDISVDGVLSIDSPKILATKVNKDTLYISGLSIEDDGEGNIKIIP